MSDSEVGRRVVGELVEDLTEGATVGDGEVGTSVAGEIVEGLTVGATEVCLIVGVFEGVVVGIGYISRNK